MGGEQRALDLVSPHCDIAVRLHAVPPSASVRGFFSRNLETQAERAGKLEAYREYFPDDRRSLMPYYRLTDYLVRLACAGAILESPERVHDGMFRAHAATRPRSPRACSVAR
jgi:hypothetical protein